MKDNIWVDVATVFYVVIVFLIGIALILALIALSKWVLLNGILNGY